MTKIGSPITKPSKLMSLKPVISPTSMTSDWTGKISDEEDKSWNDGSRTSTPLRGTDGNEKWGAYGGV